MLRRVLGVSVLAAVSALAAVAAPAESATAPPTACAAAFPVSQLHAGMRASGLTVAAGTTPQRFSATVLGVLHNGVGAGVDMVLARLDSTALRAAGGSWGGMSGSPVYAADGRLIGAVAYAMSGSGYEVGIVPAESMAAVLGAGMTAKASARAAAGPVAGLRPLPLPLTVSGVTPARMPAFTAQLERLTGSPVLAVPGDAAPAATVRSATALVPGGNVAVSQAYGDVTAAAVGTVTSTCNGRALLFGHSFSALGATIEGANTATVLYVQRDPVWGPYKVADVGPAVGTVNQDRYVGLRAVLGIPPDGIPVVSTARDAGRVRHGETVVTSSAFLSSYAPYGVVANLDALLQRYGEGSATATWTVTGLRAGGKPFALTLSNRFASPWDIAYESVTPLATELDALYTNRFEHVRFTGVHVDVSVTDEMRQYTVQSLEQLVGDAYTPLTPTTPLMVSPGDTLALRVTLLPFQGRGPVRTVDVSLAVPPDASGSASLDVLGGSGTGADPAAATSPASLDDVIAGLRATPRNDRLAVRLTLAGSGGGNQPVEQTETMDQVVTGTLSVPVTVAAPPAPAPAG